MRNAVPGASSALSEQEVDTAGYLPTPGPVDGMRVDRVRDIPGVETRLDVTRPHRIRFHYLLFVLDGRPAHSVDFDVHHLEPGDVLWVRPGQVHSFDPGFDGYEALSVALRPGFLSPATVAAAHVDSLTAPAVLRGTPTEQLLVRHGLDRLREEYDHRTGLPPDTATELVRHCLSALLLRLSQVTGARPTPEAPEPHPLATAFRAAVEADFADTRSVTEYAHRLGCSRRTLATVVGQATGHTPKEYIDARVVLEAKRLLVHTRMPVARVGARVGFLDAANFNRYFHDRTGETPAVFRATRA